MLKYFIFCLCIHLFTLLFGGGAPWGRGRSGWAAAHGCAGRRPVCGPFPRLGFAARVRCGPSPGVVRLRGRGAGGRGQLGCLRLSRRPPIAPEFPTCVAPVACSPLIWSPGGRSPQPPALQARSDAPRETRQGSRRRWPSGLLWPLSPPAGRPRVSSAYIAVPTIVLPMFGARRRALAPIRHLRPADAGVCASRSGGGASDSKTLPEYSPRPACDGGGHCATAGTPTQNAAYACGV